MRTKGCGADRSGSVPGSYPYAGEYPANAESRLLHGVSEREKQPDDIRQTCKFEIQIWESAFLVQRVLRGYSWAKSEGDRVIHKEPTPTAGAGAYVLYPIGRKLNQNPACRITIHVGQLKKEKG